MPSNPRYRVRLDRQTPPTWLAPWRSDPGRTYVSASARLFDSAEQAERARRRMVRENTHRNLSESFVEEAHDADPR